MRVIAALLAALTVVACSSDGDGPAEVTRSCAQLDRPVADTMPVPTYLKLPDEQRLLRVQTQGRTTVVFASTAGGRDDLVDVRDQVLTALKAQGFSVDGTDQEPGFEAEAQIDGPSEGTVRVTALCAGRVEVRYKLEG